MTSSLQPETCVCTGNDDSLAFEGCVDLGDGLTVLGVEESAQEA